MTSIEIVLQRTPKEALGGDVDPAARMRRQVSLGERGSLHGLPLAPAGVARMLLGEQAHVLGERAAEGDVEDLDAPTHAENRQVTSECRAHERELERVPLGLGGGEQRMRVLAVA